MKTKYAVGGALFVAFIVGNYYKFSAFSPDVHISILDVVVLTLTVWAYLSKKIKIPSALGVFLLIGLVSLVPAYFHFGSTATVVGLMYLVRFGMYSVFFLVLKSLFNASEISRLVILLGTILVLIGAMQYLVFPDIRALQVAEWDPHYYRVVGTLLDPGFVGIILVLFLVFLLEYKKPIHKLLWGVTYVVFMLTYSRSSYLGFLVAMAFVAWKRKSLKFFLFMLLLFAVTVTILPRGSDGEGVKLERTSSIQARIVNWNNSLTIFADHPLLGVGFNTYRYAQKEYGFLDNNKWLASHAGAGADSSLLFVAATTGVLGLGAYLLYLSNLWKNSPARPYIVALLAHSLFLNSLFYPFVLVFLALVTAHKLPSSLSESDSRPRQSQ